MGLFDEKTGGLIVYWRTVSAITDIVGTGDNARIWPHKARQGRGSSDPGKLDHVTFVRNGGHVFTDLSGSTGARTTILHVYAWSSTPTGAETLAEAIKNNTANTTTTRTTLSGTVVHWIFCSDAPDDGVELVESGGDNYARYWVRHVFRIVHGE